MMKLSFKKLQLNMKKIKTFDEIYDVEKKIHIKQNIIDKIKNFFIFQNIHDVKNFLEFIKCIRK